MPCQRRANRNTLPFHKTESEPRSPFFLLRFGVFARLLQITDRPFSNIPRIRPGFTRPSGVPGSINFLAQFPAFIDHARIQAVLLVKILQIRQLHTQSKSCLNWLPQYLCRLRASLQSEWARNRDRTAMRQPSTPAARSLRPAAVSAALKLSALTVAETFGRLLMMISFVRPKQFGEGQHLRVSRGVHLVFGLHHRLKISFC